jgi:hypothetical protein
MNLTEMLTFPMRVAYAFGEASIGVARLVSPGGPMRLVDQIAAMTAEERPLGKAIAPGGVVDRVLDDQGVVARLTEIGGTLDRMIEPGGLIDRTMAAGGPVDRLLAREGAIERMLAEDGVIDRLLAKEGLIEQLVEEGGIIDRLADVMETISRIAPVIESLDPAIRRIDESGHVLAATVEPLRDLAARMPGLRRRGVASGAPAASSGPVKVLNKNSGDPLH